MSASCAATAAADPLDEPPGSRRGSSGLTGVPKAALIPVIPYASSCRLVLPANRACPAAIAARSPARQAASRSAGRAWSATGREAAVVGRPAMSMRSLTATRGPVPGVLSVTIQVATAVSLCRTVPPRYQQHAGQGGHAESGEHDARRGRRAFPAEAGQRGQEGAEQERQRAHPGRRRPGDGALVGQRDGGGVRAHAAEKGDEKEQR